MPPGARHSEALMRLRWTASCSARPRIVAKPGARTVTLQGARGKAGRCGQEGSLLGGTRWRTAAAVPACFLLCSLHATCSMDHSRAKSEEHSPVLLRLIQADPADGRRVDVQADRALLALLVTGRVVAPHRMQPHAVVDVACAAGAHPARARRLELRARPATRWAKRGAEVRPGQERLQGAITRAAVLLAG